MDKFKKKIDNLFSDKIKVKYDIKYDNERMKKLENTYNFNIPSEIKKIYKSIGNITVFDDGGIVLCLFKLDEIIENYFHMWKEQGFIVIGQTFEYWIAIKSGADEKDIHILDIDGEYRENVGDFYNFLKTFVDCKCLFYWED